jgi:hypothetical protein
MRRATRSPTSAELRALREGNPRQFRFVAPGGGTPFAGLGAGAHYPGAAMFHAGPHAAHTGFQFAPVAAGTPFAHLAGPAHQAMGHQGMAHHGPAAANHGMAHHGPAAANHGMAAANRSHTKRKGSRNRSGSRSKSRNRTGKKGKKSPSPEL